MKIPCNTIKDLLPLYVEEISSKESNELIEEHINECEDCKQELERLRGDKLIPIPDLNLKKIMPLKLMQKQISIRKRRMVSLIAMIVFLIMFTIFSYLTRPIYIPYVASGIKVEKNERNEVYANFSGNITGYKASRYVSEEGKNIVEIEAWTSIWDRIHGRSTPSILLAYPSKPVDTVYYCENREGDNMKVVYGVDPNPNGGVVTLPRLVLAYYFRLACISAIVIGIIWCCIRKNKKLYKLCKYLFFIPVSYIISVLILHNQLVTFSAEHDFIMSVIEAIAVYGICILGLASYKQYKEDKAV